VPSAAYDLKTISRGFRNTAREVLTKEVAEYAKLVSQGIGERKDPWCDGRRGRSCAHLPRSATQAFIISHRADRKSLSAGELPSPVYQASEGVV